MHPASRTNPPTLDLPKVNFIGVEVEKPPLKQNIISSGIRAKRRKMNDNKRLPRRV
jgi:hypothetical protein